MLNVPRRARVPCAEHRCDCTLPQVDVDMSGLPCTPFSASGKRQAVDDPLIILYLAWLSFGKCSVFCADHIGELRWPLVLHIPCTHGS